MRTLHTRKTFLAKPSPKLRRGNLCFSRTCCGYILQNCVFVLLLVVVVRVVVVEGCKANAAKLN